MSEKFTTEENVGGYCSVIGMGIVVVAFLCALDNDCAPIAWMMCGQFLITVGRDIFKSSAKPKPEP